MTPKLCLRIITPSRVLLEADDVALVRAPLADGGGIGILPGHSPLLAESVAGDIVFEDAAGRRTYRLGEGILVIRDNTVTILTSALATAGEDGADAPQEVEATMRYERLVRAMYKALGR